MIKLCLSCLFVLQFCAYVVTQRTILDSPANVKFLRALRNWTFDTFGKTGQEGGRYLQRAQRLNRVQEPVPHNIPFPCNISMGRSPEVPNSVHRLRPGDIDVIGAMGDSLTAGAGVFATNLFHVIVENRGVVATGGGQGTWREYLTIPNIIKEFNPNLIGYALGDSLTHHPASQLNVAESGAMSRDMPYMATILTERIKNDKRIDLKKHWKLISLMIGPNDFCTEMCWIPSPWNILKNHKKELIETLRILRDNLSRTIVLLLPPPNLKTLVASREGRPSIMCDITTSFECSCLFGLAYRKYRAQYYDIMTRWQELEEEIADYPEFQRDDFTVIFQPITKNITIPLSPDGFADLTYLSTDCFHISQKMNARCANMLWNSMLEPIGQKSGYIDGLFSRFLCPTPDRPYIATLGNSYKRTNFIRQTNFGQN